MPGSLAPWDPGWEAECGKAGDNEATGSQVFPWGDPASHFTGLPLWAGGGGPAREGGALLRRVWGVPGFHASWACGFPGPGALAQEPDSFTDERAPKLRPLCDPASERQEINLKRLWINMKYSKCWNP